MLRREERIGLGLAVAAHVALGAFLVLAPSKSAVITPPERITVTISDNVGLTSTSPEPAAQAAPDVAPQLGEPAAAPPEVLPEPAPEPKPAPAPLPKPVPQPKPLPVAKPAPKPQPAPPRPAASPRPTAKAAPAANPAQTPKKTTAPAGGSRIGADFLKGVPGAQTTGASRNPPAAAIGPAVQSSLASSISRQLKRHWQAPQGADADKLVTVLSWNLNRDGSLAGPPRVVSQSGVTPANEAQKARHAEQAIRAVQLAAPFDLPDEYYDAWKRVASFRFDRRLSQ